MCIKKFKFIFNDLNLSYKIVILYNNLTKYEIYYHCITGQTSFLSTLYRDSETKNYEKIYI